MNLPCIVSGYPKPTVSWFKKGVMIRTDDKQNKRINTDENHTLIIKNVNVEDEAIYSCRASHNNGKAVVKESIVKINGIFLFKFYLFLFLHEFFNWNVYFYFNAFRINFF